MKEKWDELEMLFTEDGEITARELCLTVAVAFLLGLVLGMIFSPKKHVTITSNNGSNNINPLDEDWDEWEDEV